MAHHVFISYSSKDKEIADRVCRALEDRGVYCWIAPRNVVAGKPYSASIVSAIAQAQAFVLILSPNSNDSPHVLNELERAFNQKTPVIPYRITDVDLSESMAYYLSATHWLDATGPDAARNLESLCENIETLLGPSDGPSLDFDEVAEHFSRPHATPKKPSRPGRASSRRRTGIIAGLAVVILLILGFWYYQTHPVPQPDPPPTTTTVTTARPPQAKTGRIFVDVQPKDAEIKILDHPSQYSPGLELEPGRYKIQASHGCCEAAVKEVEISAGRDTNLVLSLIPQPGRLFLELNPKDAKVAFKDESIRYEPGLSLPSGRYELTVSKPGFASKKEMVDISPGGEVRKKITLTANVGRLFVQTSPEKAKVEMLSVDRPYKPGLELKPGRYNIEISSEGYETRREWVEIKTGRDTRLEVELEKLPGRLFVAFGPPEANVRLLNPKRDYERGMELPEGRYQIEVTLDGYETKTNWVEIKAGRDCNYSVALQPKPGNLVVRVDPPKAKVEVVGLDRPYEKGMPLEAGEYKIRAALEGYAPDEKTVKIEPGRETEISLDLKRLAGKLFVELEPPSASVKIIGSDLEYKPGLTLDQGPYRIRVEAPDHSPFERDVEIKADQETRIEVALKIMPGRLVVEAVPHDATVKIVGRDIKYEQGLELEPGLYEVEVSHPGYDTLKESLEIKPGLETTWLAALDLASTLTNSLGQEFVLIQAGTFTMGSPENEPGRRDEEIQHEVTISRPFYLQTTEVTQGQWREVMDENPSTFTDCGPDCPVEGVTWEMALEFIQRLNVRENTDKYRLPTEAEWEYAARAGSRTALARGELEETRCGPDPILESLGWYCGNSDDQPHPAAQKAPNEWGLYDMHGNVREWCSDFYAGYPENPVTNPEGPDSGSVRVNRGGSWRDYAAACRSAARINLDPSPREDVQGFRLARDP